MRPLPPVVGEGPVGLRHPVHVVLALERAALLVGRVQNLACQLLLRPLFAALPGEGDEPAHREGARPPLRYLDRHLVVGAADPPRAHPSTGVTDLTARSSTSTGLWPVFSPTISS